MFCLSRNIQNTSYRQMFVAVSVRTGSQQAWLVILQGFAGFFGLKLFLLWRRQPRWTVKAGKNQASVTLLELKLHNVYVVGNRLNTR